MRQTEDDTGAQPEAGLLTVDFQAVDLGRLRSAVRDRCRGWGLADPRLTQFVLAVHEGCTNAVLHGGGRGRLVLWREADRLCCRITDEGPGLPANWHLAGYRRHDGLMPPRGLWLINHVCDQVRLSSDRTGTTLRLDLRIPAMTGPSAPST